jgi:hypothetical protein
MANCDHDKAGICKSCRQTIKEGGTVAVHGKAAATPEAATRK